MNKLVFPTFSFLLVACLSVSCNSSDSSQLGTEKTSNLEGTVASETSTLKDEEIQPEKIDAPENWSTGGTLQFASREEWQEATYENKLATCAHHLAFMIENRVIKKNILLTHLEVDDYYPYAKKMVPLIDGYAESGEPWKEALGSWLMAIKAAEEIGILDPMKAE